MKGWCVEHSYDGQTWHRVDGEWRDGFFALRVARKLSALGLLGFLRAAPAGRVAFALNLEHASGITWHFAAAGTERVGDRLVPVWVQGEPHADRDAAMESAWRAAEAYAASREST